MWTKVFDLAYLMDGTPAPVCHNEWFDTMRGELPFSNALYDVSSSKRDWGSMEAASAPGIERNGESNAAMFFYARNVPLDSEACETFVSSERHLKAPVNGRLHTVSSLLVSWW